MTEAHEQGGLNRLEAKAYDDWKRYGRHLEEYGAELLETAYLVFWVVGFVSLMFGHSSPVPRWLPSHAMRLFLTGLLLGGTGWTIAVSPPGKLSGAHTNPAVTLGFWLLGKMHGRDVLGYWIGQAFGALLGGLIGRAVFGPLAAQVQDAALQPGPGVGPAETFWLETLTTFLLTSLVFTFVSYKSLMRWTPAAAMVLVAVLVWLDGSLSGAGMNPARWLGPAWTAREWAAPLAYVVGPLLGALAAAGLRRLLPVAHKIPHTGKLFHDHRYRSIFKHDTAPTTPPAEIS